MKIKLIILMFALLYFQLNAQPPLDSLLEQKVKIITLDENIITGEMVEENNLKVSVITDFGTISIPRTKIKSLEIISSNQKSISPLDIKIEKAPNLKNTLNQEARWRTISSAMLLGNTLYGVGIPFVLGIENPRFYTASQLLMFGGGYYASSKYTKNMHLPYGRWQMQATGAGLGIGSIVPLVSLIGFENWFSMDSDGKLTIAYLMGMAPFGAIQADKLYNKWNLSNGQATMISSSVPWGFANALGSLFLLYGDDGPDSEFAVRANFIAVYGACIGAPFLANKFFQRQSLTEDDALFTVFSTGLGFLNSLHILSMIDGGSVRGAAIVIMGITNGFGYYANHLIKDIDLDKGDWRIIGLGTGAALLTRLGVGILIGEDGGNFSTLLNIAALNAGWYFTFKKVSKDKQRIVQLNSSSKLSSISISPSIINLSSNPIPGMKIQVSFN